MAAPLILCASQEANSVAYQFRTTNVKVFSIEEALFHVFHNWKQTADDFTGREFITWVGESLNLSYYASRIQELSSAESFSERLLPFLSLTGYYGPEDLSDLKAQLREWENRLEWERLKERADFSLSSGEPSKAAALYKRALAYDRNAELLNNAGVAHMQMEMYAEAVRYIKEAAEMCGDAPPVRILQNYAEAAIYAHDFGLAENLIEAVKREAPAHEAMCLTGELLAEAGKPHEAVECIKAAIALNPEKNSVYRLSDLYCRMRKYDMALETLQSIKERDKSFYTRQAEAQAMSQNVPAAIKSIEKALLGDSYSVELWRLLAGYHRMDYDLIKAQSAVTKALAIDPTDGRARLESARIQKAQGKTRDYQAALHEILQGFKRKYREAFE